MASDKSNLVLERLEKRTRTKSSRYASSEFVDGKGLSPRADSVGNRKKHGERRDRLEGSLLNIPPPNNTVSQSNTQNSVRNDDSSDDEDSSDVSSVISDVDENEIISNTIRIEHLQANMVVVIRFLMQELPRVSLDNIANEVKNEDSADHLFIQDFVKYELERRQMDQGKNNSSNSVKDVHTAGVTTTEMAAGNSADSTPPPTTGLTYASAAAREPRAMREIFHQTVEEVLEERSRKQNIIITGLDEGYNLKEQVARMFNVMGCGFSYYDIHGTPTRLGKVDFRKNRAVRVDLGSEEAVEHVMKFKNNLKDRNRGNFYSVYVNKDMCREDREKEIAARKERNRRMYRDSAAGAGLSSGTNQEGEIGQSRRGTGSNQGHRRDAVRETENVREIEVEGGVVIPSGSDIGQTQPAVRINESGPTEENWWEERGTNVLTQQGGQTTVVNAVDAQRGQEGEGENGLLSINQNNAGNGERREEVTPT